MMTPFTHLERSVLDAICTAESSTMPALRGVLSEAIVVSRDNTGHGFYTEFRTAPIQGATWTSMISGPSALMSDMGAGAVMGFILWCSGQGPTTLEGVQLGDAVGATVDLKGYDLEALRFKSIGY
jgi:hypothetical protein